MKTLRWLVLPSFALALAACQRTTPAGDSGAEEAPIDLSADETPSSDSSLYQLHAKLVDQSGRHVDFSVHSGHPAIISMFYGSCPYACPTLIADVKRIIDTLPEARRNEVRVLLVSFDPERDTPDTLARLAQRHRLDPTTWRLASTSEGEARDIAAVLGIHYKKLDNGAFNHSSVITIVDAHGVPRFRQDGLGEPPERAGRLLRALAKLAPTAS